MLIDRSLLCIRFVAVAEEEVSVYVSGTLQNPILAFIGDDSVGRS